jgi:hypothetical protein
MQRAQAHRLDVCPTCLADSIEPLVESLQSLVDRRQLILGGSLDHLQRLVVLQLNGTITPIAYQWIIAALEVSGHPAVAVFQSIAPGSEQLLDLADILLWG